MLLNKLYKRKTELSESSECFVLKVVFNERVRAQVAYRSEQGHTKIVRFHNKYWSRELKKSEYLSDKLDMKVFVYTPNFKDDGRVQLSFQCGDKVLKEECFILKKENEFSGWFGINSPVS